MTDKSDQNTKLIFVKKRKVVSTSTAKLIKLIFHVRRMYKHVLQIEMEEKGPWNGFLGDGFSLRRVLCLKTTAIRNAGIYFSNKWTAGAMYTWILSTAQSIFSVVTVRHTAYRQQLFFPYKGKSEHVQAVKTTWHTSMGGGLIWTKQREFGCVRCSKCDRQPQVIMSSSEYKPALLTSRIWTDGDLHQFHSCIIVPSVIIPSLSHSTGLYQQLEERSQCEVGLEADLISH